jgi:membrane-associated phospholipid phosphatase
MAPSNLRAVVDTLSPLPPVEAAVPVAAPAPAPAAVARPAAHYRWLTCSALLLLAVILERWLLVSHIFPGDRWAAQIGMEHKAWPIWDITRVYQQVGRPLVAVGEVAVMLAWLWRSAGRREIQGLFIVLMASVCCGVIKILCGPTPLWTVLDHHVGTNFPSGVVTFMTATVGYVALLAWRRGRRVVPVALLLAILGAGPARVLGGQHLISDVLGAYMLGLSWLLLAHVYLLTPVRRARRQARWAMPSLDSVD